MQVAQTGICGSDVHYWQRGRIGGNQHYFKFTADSIADADFGQTLSSPPPLSLATRVPALSSRLDPRSRTSRWAIGLRLSPACHADSKVDRQQQQKAESRKYLTSSSCDYCRSGSYNLCPDTVFAATPPHDGTLSKYYITQADYCYPLPDHMDLEEGALVEPVAVAVQITKVGNVKANQTIVVFGCGPIGLLCQAVCKAYSAKKVIGVDISQSRAAFAKSFGADDVFVPPARPEGTDDTAWNEAVAKIMKEKFNLGEGPDVVLEATGAQACIQTGIHLTKKGGTYVQAGMGREVSLHPPFWKKTAHETDSRRTSSSLSRLLVSVTCTFGARSGIPLVATRLLWI